MPPPRRAPQEDSTSRSEELVPSKLKAASQGPSRRKANGHVSHTTNLREIASSNNALAASAMNGTGEVRPENSSLFEWSTISSTLLHRYTYHHHLNLPTPFHNPTAPIILGPHTGFGRAAGIGKYSPTMARPRARRRVPREELSKLVRKHFNAMSVSEADVIVDVMYTVKFQDKAFSAKFAPSRRNVVDSGGGIPVPEATRTQNGRVDQARPQQQR